MRQNMSTVIVGYGDVGKALFKKIKPCLNTVHRIDPGESMYEARLSKYDYMAVTIPVQVDRDGKPEIECFIETVREYKRKYSPKCIIVFSTVPVGTCEKLEVAHAPIEGRHPNLFASLKHWNYMLGYDGVNKLYEYVFWFKCIRSKVNVVPSRVTEFLKLQSTLMYGVNLEFARWVGDMCKELNIGYNYIKEYNRNYNELYKVLRQDDIRRYILEPPEGPIGGHCIIPNAEMIQYSYPNKWSKILMEGEK